MQQFFIVITFCCARFCDTIQIRHSCLKQIEYNNIKWLCYIFKVLYPYLFLSYIFKTRIHFRLKMGIKIYISNNSGNKEVRQEVIRRDVRSCVPDPYHGWQGCESRCFGRIRVSKFGLILIRYDFPQILIFSYSIYWQKY